MHWQSFGAMMCFPELRLHVVTVMLCGWCQKYGTAGHVGYSCVCLHCFGSLAYAPAHV